MTLVLLSSYPAAEHSVVDNQHDDRSDYRDNHAVEIEAGNAAGAKGAEDEASHNRPNNSEHNVEEKALTRFVDDLAGDETCDKAQ